MSQASASLGVFQYGILEDAQLAIDAICVLVIAALSCLVDLVLNILILIRSFQTEIVVVNYPFLIESDKSLTTPLLIEIQSTLGIARISYPT
jgi:hypothetical protein